MSWPPGWDDDRAYCNGCTLEWDQCRCEELDAIRQELGLAPDCEFWIATREEIIAGSEVIVYVPRPREEA